MKTYLSIAVLLMTAIPSSAQDIGHMQHSARDSASNLRRHNQIDMTGMHHDTLQHMIMTSQFSLDLPMNRDGSGTSWMPDETPMYMYMVQGKQWMQMFHGSLFARYNNQDLFNQGTRGGKKLDAPNWLMYMAQRQVGRNGLFSVNTMFSLDPFLVGSGGYPLLYQTGESYKGNKLVDRQHPHDLFDELSIAYTQRVAKNTELSLSIAYPGEPALGPPAFMHRVSAMNNPDAPLSHHYADATHITFGTATLGFRYKNLKLEGSVFTGREPDEYRYGFDKPKFDSYSVRLSVNPTKEWALQVSNGWLKSPEQAEHTENVDRFTASAIHTKRLNDNSYISTTLVYGQNTHDGRTEPSILIESSLQLNKAAIYGRYEYVQKGSEELNLNELYPGNLNFKINAVTLGTNRKIATIKQTNLTLGVQATANFSPTALKNLYGAAPIGFQAYLRVTPSLMKSGSKHKMNMSHTMAGMTNDLNTYDQDKAVFKSFEDTTKNGSYSARFQSLKGNTIKLITGETSAGLLIYFKKYLETKDKKRADSVATIILKFDDSPEIKYQLSLTYYQFTGTTETERLFLSAGNNINANLNYLVHRKSAEIKNRNSLVWARYYNLTQLDSANYRINKSDTLRVQMSEHYNSLAWNSLLIRQAQKAAYYLNKSYEYNNQSKFYYTNYPHILLFNGEYAKAKEWYLRYKDLPFDHDYPKYKDVFLEDFMEFTKAGLTIPHMAEITALLNK